MKIRGKVQQRSSEEPDEEKGRESRGLPTKNNPKKKVFYFAVGKSGASSNKAVGVGAKGLSQKNLNVIMVQAEKT